MSVSQSVVPLSSVRNVAGSWRYTIVSYGEVSRYVRMKGSVLMRSRTAAMFIFLSSGVALAQSEVVQEQIISEETIVRSIDNGYVDELRVTKGLSRVVTSVPTGEFPDVQFPYWTQVCGARV